MALRAAPVLLVLFFVLNAWPLVIHADSVQAIVSQSSTLSTSSSSLPPEVADGIAQVFGTPPPPRSPVQPRPEPDPPLLAPRTAPQTTAEQPRPPDAILTIGDDIPAGTATGVTLTVSAGSPVTQPAAQSNSSVPVKAVQLPTASTQPTDSDVRPNVANVGGGNDSDVELIVDDSTMTTPDNSVSPVAGSRPARNTQDESNMHGRSEDDASKTTTESNSNGSDTISIQSRKTPAPESNTTVLEVALALAPYPAKLDWQAIDPALRGVFERATRTTTRDWTVVALSATPPRGLVYQGNVSKDATAEASEALSKMVNSGAAGVLAGVVVALSSPPRAGVARRTAVELPTLTVDGVREEAGNSIDSDDGDGQDAESEERTGRDMAMALAGAGGLAGVALLIRGGFLAIRAARRRKSNPSVSGVESSYGEEEYEADEARRSSVTQTTATRMTGGGRRDGRADIVRTQSRVADWMSGSDAFSSAEIVAL